MISKKLTTIDWQGLTPQPVIGVDEVGRGCLAGPVYAAAVVLNPHNEILKYRDSKLLSEVRREEWAEHIITHHQSAVGIATVEEIDRLNILQASLLAMKRAVESLEILAGLVMVDGNQSIPGLGFKQMTVIKGDQRVLPIAAASIVAKVARDKFMKELGTRFPEYQFEKHKGYGTEVHQTAIKIYGPTEFHRRYFRGVREQYERQAAPHRL
ncbi:MAG: ribonuclease HII [Pseudomonadota bacterium]|mgnify:CR=1 FL=1|nr:ribonuclease HII [Pseudomonadota bacterium]